MRDLKSRAQDFLSHRRIAVAGVSRTDQDAANGIYKRLRELEYDVYAVNPNADEVEGDLCYHSLFDLPDDVESLVIVTTPTVTEALVHQCVDAGIKRVWMHRSFGNSVSDNAVAYAREQGLDVLDGGCPMMFLEPVDVFHKCIRPLMGLAGRMPSAN